MSDLLNSASLVVIPSGYKEDTVYSVVPSDGSGDLSFTRASNGTRVNSAGLVEVCPWNLMQYSEDFTNAVWVKQNGITATANTATAPNGTTTADTLEKTGGSGGTDYYYIVAPTNTFAQLTNFFYVKHKSGSGIVWLLGLNSGSFAFYDVVNGTALSKSSGMTTSIESVGNGWYKCIFSQDYGGASSTTFGIGVCLADGTPNYNATTAATQSVYIWGAQSNIGATAKPYFPTTDRLNVPRLTYQNGGGGCPSLLLEKQSTNLALYSEDFGNAYWTKTRATISANNATSPDGTTNADKLVEDAISGTHFVDRTITGLTASALHSFSIFAKKAEREFVNVQCVTTGNSVFVNLNNGAISIGGGYTSSTVKVESYSNSWYRITVNDTPPSTSLRYIVVTAIDSTTSSYTGNGTSGLFIWGAQLEASSYPTSYIPTTSSSATRVADACFKTGISSLIGQTEGTIFLDFYYNLTSVINTASARFQLSDGTTDKWILVSIPDASTQSVRFYQNNNGVDLSYNSSTNLLLGRNKVAVAYKSGQYAMYLNGVLSNSSTSSATVPATSRMDLTGNVPNDPTVVEGEFNQIVLFPTRLTNAELASLTTI
jgi:hypothetical protein